MDFLVAAVSDLADDGPPSELKFGLVNLFTGTEILLKARLERENWKLVFANVAEANRGSLKSGDFRSVGVQGAIRRLESECSVQIQVEHKQAIQLVRKERNKIIHFGHVGNPMQLRPVAAKTLAFSISFISEELQPGGLNEEASNLLEGIRGGLRGIQHYVTERWREIRPILAAFYSPIVQCPSCLEKAMTSDGGQSKCEFCSVTEDGESVADLFAHNVLDLHRYQVVTHGGEWPVHQCPECGRSAFVEGVEGTTLHSTRWVCFSCGVEAEDSEIWPCLRCNEPVITDEGPYAFCDTCSYT